MARGIVTPWRTHQDLLNIRRQLYRLDGFDTAPDTRDLAVQRVMAWKARGNLPHAVESTALLLDAVLHHRNTTNSVFSIRAVYSAAFTRFVTGFCDIGRSKERLLEPSSMLDIAKQIDMPVEFVTLRHEATHQELPEIHRLVSATEDALDWLWAVYWSRLEDRSSGTESAATGSLTATQYKTDARQRLREFRGQRREALRSRQSSASAREQEARKAARSFADAMPADGNRIEVLVSVLLEDKLLLPTKREMGASLDGAFLIWDPLLQEMSRDKKRFLQVLINSILHLLDQTPMHGADANADAEALCLWLIHFVDPQSWAVLVLAEKQLIRTHIVKWCCTHPGHWAQYLGAAILRSGGEEFERVWADILNAGLLGLHGQTSLTSDAPAEVQGPAAAEGSGAMAVDQLGMHGEGGDVPMTLSGVSGDDAARANWIRQPARLPTVAALGYVP